MDCATVTDGKLDESIELPGKQIAISGKLSKVKTDLFLTFLKCDGACQGLGFMSSNGIDP
jgi:hypothetical protein